MKSENELSLYWQKMLKPLISIQTNKASSLAEIIKVQIEAGILFFEEDIPTQRAIINYTGLSKGTVESAFRLLREDEYIITNGSGGSTVSWGTKLEADTKSGSHPREYHFDDETLSTDSLVMKDFMRAMKRAENKNANLSTAERKSISNRDLIKKFTALVNDKLPSCYLHDQICYCYTRLKAIDSICRLFLPHKKIVLMPNPAEVCIKKAFMASNAVVNIVENSSNKVFIDGIEKACAEGSVGIVYLSSRSALNVGEDFSRFQITRLLNLQKKYGFLIIEDDFYASYYEKRVNILMELANEMKADVMYMRALSMNLPDLSDVIIVGGSAVRIGSLKTIMENTGRTINAYKSSVLLSLISNNSFKINHKKIYDRTTQLNKIARKELINANLWQVDSTTNTEGWVFTLKLIKGTFPNDIYALLAKKKIFIMNPDEYESLNSGINEIRISIAGYYDTDRLIGDLAYLNQNVKEILQGNK